MSCSLLLFLQPLLKAHGWSGRSRWDISCAPRSSNIHPESLTSGKKMLMLSSHVAATVEVHVCTWALQLQWKTFCRATLKNAGLTFWCWELKTGVNNWPSWLALFHVGTALPVTVTRGHDSTSVSQVSYIRSEAHDIKHVRTLIPAPCVSLMEIEADV